MPSGPTDRRGLLEDAISHLEGFLADFAAQTEGVSTSPDDLVWVRVRTNGDCQIRINPRESGTDEIEEQVRLTYNSAVRRMSRRLIGSGPIVRLARPEEGGRDADGRP